MQKKLIKFVSSSILLSFLCISTNISAATYYKCTPDDEEWKSMTLDEKKKNTEIRDEKLAKLTDEELIDAIKEYPFLIDLYAFDSITDGIRHVTEECDAYKELLHRKNGARILSQYIKKSIKDPDKVSADRQIKIESLSALLLYQPKFVDQASILDFKGIEKLSNVSEVFGTPTYRVKTP